MKLLLLSLLVPVVVTAACTAEGVKAGDPCSGSGSCKAPLSCYETPKGSFCGSSCDFEAGKHTCKDPALAPADTTVRGLPAGCACLPK